MSVPCLVRLPDRRALIPDMQALDFCRAEIVFHFLLGHSRRTPRHQMNDQEHDSNHE
jgi:hypothetical protein